MIACKQAFLEPGSENSGVIEAEKGQELCARVVAFSVSARATNIRTRIFITTGPRSNACVEITKKNELVVVRDTMEDDLQIVVKVILVFAKTADSGCLADDNMKGKTVSTTFHAQQGNRKSRRNCTPL